MHDLVVMSPFGGYRIAQRITDNAAIAAIEADPHKLAKCRRVFAEAKPAAAEPVAAVVPPPAPAPVEIKPEPKADAKASADKA